MRCRLLALLSLSLAVVAAGREASPTELRVMSYNLRYASMQPAEAWPERRPVMTALIAREAPDVIGTQEGLYQQLRDIAADLPDYEWIGLGRAGGSHDEFTAIFFRRDRFEPVEFDHFWLSDTPDVIGSRTWGNHYRRMVTWVRLRDRSTGREFEIWNTHLDNQFEEARRKGAALIGDRIAKVDPSIPLVLTGDFNSAAGDSAAYDILTKEGGLTDTWTVAARRTNDGLNTFNNFETPKHTGDRIDWILARNPSTVPQAAVVDYDGLPRFPSDHFPVIATIRFD